MSPSYQELNFKTFKNKDPNILVIINMLGSFVLFEMLFSTL